MPSINKVILMGHLGADPELRSFPDGSAVVNVSLATSERWKDKTTGEPQDKTEWHRLVFFRRVAEIAGQYLKKGSLIYVEGKLQTRKWQDAQGVERYTTEVVVNEMKMLDKRDDRDDNSARTQSGQQSNGQRAQNTQEEALAAGGAHFNDDIPF